MDVDKLCSNCLEIVNTALGIEAVSVGVPTLSIFSSMMRKIHVCSSLSHGGAHMPASDI